MRAHDTFCIQVIFLFKHADDLRGGGGNPEEGNVLRPRLTDISIDNYLEFLAKQYNNHCSLLARCALFARYHPTKASHSNEAQYS